MKGCRVECDYFDGCGGMLWAFVLQADGQQPPLLLPTPLVISTNFNPNLDRSGAITFIRRRSLVTTKAPR